MMPVHSFTQLLSFRRAATAVLAHAGIALVVAASIGIDTAGAQTTPSSETAVTAPTGVRGFGPNGATLRCRDGFLPPPGAPDAACAERGGVAARYPIRRTPQRAADARAAAARQPQTTGAARVEAPRADTTRPAGVEPYAVRRARADSLNRASRPPAGATLGCNDGTWIVRDTVRARCAAHGGVRVTLPPSQ